MISCTVPRRPRRLAAPNPRFSKEPAAEGQGGSGSPETILREWLQSIKTRQKTTDNELEGYYSSVACYMALEAFRTQDRVRWQDGWRSN